MPSDATTPYLLTLPLSDADRDEVETRLAAIRLNTARSLRLRVANGHHLIRIKRLIGHGGWMEWMIGDAQSGYHSVRTLERDMSLADALGDSLDGFTDEQLARATNLTALRELARDPNADALSAALELLKQGVVVLPAQAEALVDIGQADSRLLDSVVEGRMTISDAKAVATRLRQPMLADVEELVLNSGVRSPEVVDALVTLANTNLKAFDEVAAAGAFYNPLTSSQVPLNQASPADAGTALAVEEAEREARRIGYFQTWKQNQPARVADVVGRRAELLAALSTLIPDDGKAYHVLAYPEATPEPEMIK